MRTYSNETLEKEIKSLRCDLNSVVYVCNQIVDWLEGEIKHNEPVINGKEVLTDGTDDIHVGRSDCAKALLKQIEKWEKE